MTTISLRVNDDESKLIHDYVSVNQLNMSQFIRKHLNYLLVCKFLLF